MIRTTIRLIVACIVVALGRPAGLHAQVPAIPSTEKARVVVLTDVANEPDDEQSFIRLLLYSNELDIECISHAWVRKNVQNNHGPLGPLYPLAKYKYEGDTPSFFHLLPIGLSDPEQPHWGSWGGRFTREEVVNPEMRGKYGTWQERCRPYAMHVDARDTWTYEERTFRDNQFAPLFRWRDAWQNDFAARMDWCVNPWNKANHQPHPIVNGDNSRRPVSYTHLRAHETYITISYSLFCL